MNAILLVTDSLDSSGFPSAYVQKKQHNCVSHNPWINVEEQIMASLAIRSHLRNTVRQLTVRHKEVSKNSVCSRNVLRTNSQRRHIRWDVGRRQGCKAAFGRSMHP
jgi:hypothetical protein